MLLGGTIYGGYLGLYGRLVALHELVHADEFVQVRLIGVNVRQQCVAADALIHALSRRLMLLRL